MSLSLDSRVKPNPDVIVTELTDRDGKPEAVLLNIATQKYFSLNLSGIRIWKALEQQLPLSAAAADLVERLMSPKRKRRTPCCGWPTSWRMPS